MANLLTAIFTHPKFTESASLQGLVKQPTEYVVGALRSLGITPAQITANPQFLVRTFQSLGQVLFDPPSVGGWPQNALLALDGGPLARWQFAQHLAHSGDISTVSDAAATDRVDAAAALLSVPRWSAASAAALKRAANDPPTLMTLALVSPEYVSN